jgi:signal transduction histidine kinase
MSAHRDGEAACFVGDGETAALMRAIDWGETPIGPVETWSPTLRMMVSFLLANRFPLLLWWGPHYVSIYNDAYRPILGTKHPRSMGQPVSKCWSEIWHILKPLIDTPFSGGPATWMEDIPLEVNRYGFVEETHFTIAYSPVPDDTAPHGIGGVLATVHEITEKVVGERRVVALRDLGARVSEAKTAETACAMAAATLANHPKDVPFALLYLIDTDGKEARLAGAAGVAPGEAASPLAVSLGAAAADEPWPLADAVRREEMMTVEDLAARFGRVPEGPWSDPPHTAAILPIRSNKAHQLAGLLVAGLSPRLRFDDLYRSFLELVSGQIATTIANARAYEEERRRAEALAEIDRAKTAFFSNVSHEFRTPLTLMLGPLEDALADAALPAAERERLDLAHRNALRLLKLVNSLLDFSRIEAGRAQASYEPVDLAALTADLASNFRSACERAGLTLAIDCPALAEPVHVDRDMWEKIVLNLLSNAFKFTFAGGIAVRLRAAEGRAELTVRDTGVGVPEDEFPRLFERFHRIAGQRSRTHEGSGIGLALVQELVKLHGGAIAAESRVGEGTCFTVTVPFGTAHLPADRISAERRLASTSVRAEAYVEEALRWLPDEAASFPAAGELAEPGELPLLDSARILVADDNADMRGYVRRVLGRNFTVEAVADGQAALAAIRERRPDLVLADVMMPRLDGFELLRAIRDDPALCDLPVIMLSARAGEESRVEGLHAGADDYLVKPFSARELAARVGASLKLSRARSEAEERLREMNRSLERKVAERSRALEAEVAEREKIQEALQQAQRLEAIGQLTGGVAHDFNNLLTVVLGQTEAIIANAKGNERITRMAAAAQRAAERGARLTTQLLAFARRQQLQPVIVAVPSLIANIGDLLRRAVGESVAISLDIEPGLWPCRVDQTQFESAILNLAINARDAMPNGGSLTVRAVNARPAEAEARRLDLVPGDYVVTSVTDDGAGMPEEVMQRAFEPFFTTKDVGKGTGLGLAQAYGFARQSGGTATIESAVASGTTVSMYFPRAEPGAPRADAAADQPAKTEP